MKCCHCHQPISREEYERGFCVSSPNSFHQVKVKFEVTTPRTRHDAHLGGVGGE